MIIVDPVALGDVACTRASAKWVYDRTGTLVEVPANTLGVTYDPADLSRAPYATVEPAAVNRLKMNTRLDHTEWPKNRVTVDGDTAISPDGTLYADKVVPDASFAAHYIEQQVNQSFSDGEVYTFSVYVKAGGIARVRLDLYYAIGSTGGHAATFNLDAETCFALSPDIKSVKIEPLPGGWYRCILTSTVTFSAVHPNRVLCRFVFYDVNNLVTFSGNGVDGLWIWGPQFEDGDKATSLIKTLDVPVTRAADVIGAGAGLVYSNVPITEAPYSATATYAKDAAVHDPVTKIVYWSMQASNVGKPLSDPLWWNKRSAINRWAMFDDRNSTVTSNPEEIIAVVSARAITQGLFAGALDASEVRISMTHPTRGVVYSEKRALALPRSGSSFYGWCFNRLQMRTWFLTLKLPVFANALVTITIRRPGGVAKCGMCMIGPAIDVGLSLMGLSTELKDYSTTTFYPDGSSDTIPRGFSKRMSIDLLVERDRVESIEDDLIRRRQKTLVWLGSTVRGDTMLVGKFSSFRKVIDSYPRSKMALQIEGVLSQ
ncbi:phage head spike fiber domain-containing protein [Massilia sp. CFBP9026]|uniref:phage head spike fiber domain-containing protein n=1 Tax=Massilia sp. CFBP9026 TaxID=3096536 RepID=UPI002A6AADA9|nr:hypothetical protein [Massilia sp. CFBP9026]MDY0961732.1 hypothetical protein [Massilia sp. CFBP9026]